MREIPGSRPSEVQELARIQDRLSFLYVEHCLVERDDNAITFTDERGTVYIPSAAIGVLLLGPGTNVTHQAMVVIADSGATAIWVGEQGVRMYASGRSMARSAHLSIRQAKLVSNKCSRLEVARFMYQMRFPGEDVTSLTMQQLRGREGARVRVAYRAAAKKYGVKWAGRDYNPEDFLASNEINQALSAANVCLYGVVHAVILALGCVPALGFVHTGHDLSFVYDIADLYKVQLSVPVAFQTVGELQGTWPINQSDNEVSVGDWENLPGIIRRRMRDRIKDSKLLIRCVHDVKNILTFSDSEKSDIAESEEAEILSLWDERFGRVEAGKLYSAEIIKD